MKINSKSRIYDVSESLQINVNDNELWEIISSPGNLNNCHPYCEKNNVKIWPGVGSSDSIMYFNGLTLKREFIEWNVNKGYALIIGKGKLAAANVFW